MRIMHCVDFTPHDTSWQFPFEASGLTSGAQVQLQVA
jgi:hypothetical protein